MKQVNLLSTVPGVQDVRLLCINSLQCINSHTILVPYSNRSVLTSDFCINYGDRGDRCDCEPEGHTRSHDSLSTQYPLAVISYKSATSKETTKIQRSNDVGIPGHVNVEAGTKSICSSVSTIMVHARHTAHLVNQTWAFPFPPAAAAHWPWASRPPPRRPACRLCPPPA